MQKLKDCKKVDFQLRGDERGNLVVVEGNLQVPFDIKRLFYIFGVESNAVRGEHANLYSEFMMICIAGNCKVRLFDGYDEDIIVLQKPHQGLYIPKMIWKEMYDFSKDCILLVLSDKHYDATEYIRNKAEYMAKIRK